jgi:magnesium transporter
MHHADIAEILDELDFDEATYLRWFRENLWNTSWIRRWFEENILKRLSAKEIAEELDELNTDDAADIIAELSQSKKENK